MKYFVQGLKAIAQILLRDEFDDSTVDMKQPMKMTIFGLTNFVTCADGLYESGDVTAQEYATLLNAIFSGHAGIESLFDLYHNPDFNKNSDGSKMDLTEEKHEFEDLDILKGDSNVHVRLRSHV